MHIGSEGIELYLEGLRRALITRGHLLLFAGMFIECIPIAGFIMPGLTLLVIAGFLSANESLSYSIYTVVSAIMGIAAADNAAFLVGRLGVHKVGWIARLVKRHEELALDIATQRFIILVLYQFPPYSRMFAPIVMGTISFPMRRWATVVSLGTLLFVTVFFGLGFSVGFLGRRLFGAVNLASNISVVFILGLLSWIIVFGSRIHRRRSTGNRGTHSTPGMGS